VTKVDEAAGWLAPYLAGGPRPARDVQAAAEEAGITAATLRRASSVLGVQKSKRGAPGEPGEWLWSLEAFDADGGRLRAEPVGVSDGGGEHVRTPEVGAFEAAFEVLASLVLEDGRRWVDVADEVMPGVVRLDHSSSGHDDMAVTIGMAAHHLVERTGSGRPAGGGWNENRTPVSTPAGTPSWAATSATVVVAPGGATSIHRLPPPIGKSRRFSKSSVST
jgi:hypothetical protein